VFRKLLKSAIENKDFTKVDYYLTGTGMDSLPVLIEQACDESLNGFNGVTAYLLILSAIEVLRIPELEERPNVKDNLRNVEANLEKLKKGLAIKLENNSLKNRTDFFQWFETQFYREYIELEVPYPSPELVAL
jgi:hypothetical protein